MRNAARSPRGRLCLYVVGILAAVYAISYLYGQIDFWSPSHRQMDLTKYRVMAQAAPHLAENVHQPFAYRLLGPYLAGLFPWHDSTAFYVLTLLSIAVFSIVYFAFQTSAGISFGIATFTTIVFLLNHYLIGFAIWDYFQLNDTLSLTFATLTFLALWKRQWWLFGGAFLLGAVTRETIFIMIPVSLVYLWECRSTRREVVYLILACIPGLFAFGALQLLTAPPEGWGLFDAFLEYVNKLSSLDTWFRLLVRPFLPVAFLPIIFWRATVEFFRTRIYMLVYIGLVFISTLFAVDNERLMAPAGIIFYLLFAFILTQHAPIHPWFLILIMISAVFTSFHDAWARYPLPNRQLTLLFSLGATFAVCVGSLIICLGISRRPRNHTPPSIPYD